MRIKIEVNQGHISRGIRRDCSICPVGLALFDKGYAYVKVDTGHISYGSHPYRDRTIAKTPRSVYRFIQSFDAGRPVKPFNFFLETK